LLVDPVELEGAVVAPALEYLGEEPLDATTGAGDRRIEEDQARLLLDGAGRGVYDAPPVAGDWIGGADAPRRLDIPYPRDRSV
jgi:hypothetical protein